MKQRFTLICVPALLFLFNLRVLAQSDSDKVKTSLIIGSTITITGPGTQLTTLVTFKNTSFYAGPRFSFNSYTFKEGFWGIKAGARQTIITAERFNFFINLDYENLFIKPKLPERYGPAKFNVIHELNLCYGFEWKIMPSSNMWLGSDLGCGIFVERDRDLIDKEMIYQFSGYSRIFEIYLRYQF